MSEGGRYFGKYRGVVTDNVDPMQMGRVQAQVPDVLGTTPSGWAMPCVPFAGRQMGLLALPQIGAGVWVEFEKGDIDYPIWTGCWWGSAEELPPAARTAPAGVSSAVVQTAGQTVLVLSDAPGPAGGILLKTGSGAMIAVNDTGITISNGQGASVTLTGPSVSVNDGALGVT